MLNERLYAPESTFDIGLNFSATIYDAAGSPCNRIFVSANILYVTLSSNNINSEIYNFKTNEWNKRYQNVMKLIITSASANTAFRAWLASNATKQ